LIFSIVGGLLSLFGSLLLVHLQSQTEILQKIMGFVILFLGIPLLYLKNTGLHEAERPGWLKVTGSILIAISVFLQTIFASGIGGIQTIVFITCFGMTALAASATKRAMQLTVTSISLFVYIMAGLVDYRFGLAGFIASFAGGYVGSHIAIKKGNKFVLNLFAAVSAILALQLLFG